MGLQIWCALRRHCAHFVGRRRDPGSQKCIIFIWYILGSVFPVTLRKEAAVCHQAEPGGYEDDLGGGQTSCDQRPLRRRLLAVVGAHRKYIGGKFWGNTFFCTRNSFCFISFVAFDFDCTSYGQWTWLPDPSASAQLLLKLWIIGQSCPPCTDMVASSILTSLAAPQAVYYWTKLSSLYRHGCQFHLDEPSCSSSCLLLDKVVLPL